jgi:DNA mismatch endonuclease, patch repair protein
MGQRWTRLGPGPAAGERLDPFVGTHPLDEANLSLVVAKPVPSSLGVSTRMSRQRRRDTEPELALRRLLHARGLRYRVAWRIPGMPRRTVDIAFPRSMVAVFVDGCFWHSCPIHKTSPTANSAWWATKLATNQGRDAATDAHLAELGWQVIRIWEHEDASDAADRIERMIRSASIREGDTALAPACRPTEDPPAIYDGTPATTADRLRSGNSGRRTM